LSFFDEGLGEVLAEPAVFGDVVLGRRDVPASYHLCVTCDDAAQGVTHVTRGEDLLAATHVHRLLQFLFGWPVPVYAHHGLLQGADGTRLSKRDGAMSLRAMREAGVKVEEIIGRW
jgi:glutamyl-Q tRNA(Asp) synthetase